MAKYHYMSRHQHLLYDQHWMDNTSQRFGDSLRRRFNSFFAVYWINSTLEYIFLCYSRFYKQFSIVIAPHIILLHVHIVCCGCRIYFHVCCFSKVFHLFYYHFTAESFLHDLTIYNSSKIS